MTQKISVQFFDAADAKEVNALMRGVQPRGIYLGAYLTKVIDTQVSISAFTVVIGDTLYQVKCESNAAELVSVSVGTPYVVMRWSYAESPVNVITFHGVALGGILTNDIVVGRCMYTGSILSSFDYSDRIVPNVQNLYLRVIPMVPASMAVRILPGKVNYGVRNYDIDDQISPAFAAPTTNPRIDLVYVDTDGVVKVSTGTPAASPSAPLYNGKSGLAEISLAVGQTSITAASIKDVRAFLSGGGYAIYAS